MNLQFGLSIPKFFLVLEIRYIVSSLNFNYEYNISTINYFKLFNIYILLYFTHYLL